MNPLMRTKAWLVGFIPSPNRGFFRLLGGNDHVYALRHDEETARWLLVEHSVAGLAVEVWDDKKAHRLIDHTTLNGRLLLVGKRVREVSFVAPPLQSCVSVVKALVGVQSFWTITPRQLYRLLVRRGAIELGEARDEHVRRWRGSGEDPRGEATGA